MNRRDFAKTVFALPAVAAISPKSLELQIGSWDEVLLVSLEMNLDGMEQVETDRIAKELAEVVYEQSGRHIPCYVCHIGSKLKLHKVGGEISVETVEA